jgi:hypothetical protein
VDLDEVAGAARNNPHVREVPMPICTQHRTTAVAYCPSRREGQCSQFSMSCVACRRSHRLIIARTSSFLSERGMR